VTCTAGSITRVWPQACTRWVNVYTAREVLWQQCTGTLRIRKPSASRNGSLNLVARFQNHRRIILRFRVVESELPEEKRLESRCRRLLFGQLDATEPQDLG
jgi:hypothetical protein